MRSNQLIFIIIAAYMLCFINLQLPAISFIGNNNKDFSNNIINANNNNNNPTLLPYEHQSDGQVKPLRIASQFSANLSSIALKIGKDLYLATSNTNCLKALRDSYNPPIDLSKFDSEQKFGGAKPTLNSIDWPKYNLEIANSMNTTMRWHESALDEIRKSAEKFADEFDPMSEDNKKEISFVSVHSQPQYDDSSNSDEDLSNNLSSIDSEEKSNNVISADSLVPTSSSSSSNKLNPVDDTEILRPIAMRSVRSSGSNNNETLDNTDSSNDSNFDSTLSSDSASIEDNDLNLNSMPTNTAATAAIGVEEATTAAGIVEIIPVSATSTDKVVPLEKQPIFEYHKNFEVPISLAESAIHTPIHIYIADEQIVQTMRWSSKLDEVFKRNMQLNPRLTNQYIASYTGLMRMYPAQPWPPVEPDLYDARMRPWYSMAATSSKDMVLLVDSSGSMTGSRRDIAKGVVFELLDTLTDNDHFVVLKFSDRVQTVGMPHCKKLCTPHRFKNIKKEHLAEFALSNTNNNNNGNKFLRSTNNLNIINNNNNNNYNNDNSLHLSCPTNSDEETDIDRIAMLPASGANIRHVKSNFTIATSGIANFSNALDTAFQVLLRQSGKRQVCNQAIMLITDGSPSSFDEIFKHYNHPNAHFRMFTYLIGREAGDVSHTKMMACLNRGYYTHVINLAEVRETVQQYLPVMARPIVLSRQHPINWTPAYGNFKYQTLTDWVWEERQRTRARALLEASKSGIQMRIQTSSNTGIDNVDFGIVANNLLRSSNGDSGGSSNVNGVDADGVSISEFADSELQLLSADKVDLFGYLSDSLNCFWEQRDNNANGAHDLLTTVVQPIYSSKNETLLTERLMIKNVYTVRRRMVNNAQLLGVAGVDLRIRDLLALAPSFKLGPNAYIALLTNNGHLMAHRDLRPFVETAPSDKSEEQNMTANILKPFYSSLDLTQLEHPSSDADLSELRKVRSEAVGGKIGWHSLSTQRAFDCMRRVQISKLSMYTTPINNQNYALLVAVPQPYGAHKVDAQIEIKTASLPEQLNTYFMPGEFDSWTLHPSYEYCDGFRGSDKSISAVLDIVKRIEKKRANEIQWRAQSQKPPLEFPNKLICDKDLIQSLLYDVVATFATTHDSGDTQTCGNTNGPFKESSLLSMTGARFSFISTRSGLTRVKRLVDDAIVKRDSDAFIRKHSKTIDEIFYQRTVDFNLLTEEEAVLIQVPFNTHAKIKRRFAAYEQQLQVQALNNAKQSTTNNNVSSSSLPTTVNSEQSTVEDLPNTYKNKPLSSMSLSEKLTLLSNSSLYAISTQTVVAGAGQSRAAAAVVGVFHDYATLATRFFNLSSPTLAPDLPFTTLAGQQVCGQLGDSIDCLLIDNSGFVVVSEQLQFVGRHLRVYDPTLLEKLVEFEVFSRIALADNQAICELDPRDILQSNAQVSASQSSLHGLSTFNSVEGSLAILNNVILSLSKIFALLVSLLSTNFVAQFSLAAQQQQQQQTWSPYTRTLLRPCVKTSTLYELNTNNRNTFTNINSYTTNNSQDNANNNNNNNYNNIHIEFNNKCNHKMWATYERIPHTNLLLLIVGLNEINELEIEKASECFQADNLLSSNDIQVDTTANSKDDASVCERLVFESELEKQRPKLCFSNNTGEDRINLCGGANQIAILINIWLSIPIALLTLITLINFNF